MELYQPTLVLPARESRFPDAFVQMVREHIARRTGLNLPVSDLLPPEGGSAIVILRERDLDILKPQYICDINRIDPAGAEGYRIAIGGNPARPCIFVVGADDRGVLYGIGRLLRNLLLEAGKIGIKPGFAGGSYTPVLPVRGTHLSYTDQSTTFDAWTDLQFERYIQEIALFGINTLSLAGPWLGRRPFSPLYKEEPADMLLKVARAAKRLGLDVWLDIANIYAERESAGEELAPEEWGELERLLPLLPELGGVVASAATVDDVDHLSRLLSRFQPSAGIWLVFRPTLTGADRLLAHLFSLPERPARLAGVVITGNEHPDHLAWLQAQSRHKSLPVVMYADITHSGESTFPAADSDSRLARFYGRAGIQPRPQAMVSAHDFYMPVIQGSVTYSEGVHDDLNKIVWADQDWQPGREVKHTVDEYSALLISAEYREQLAAGWTSIEHNWHGPLDENTSIDASYQLWSDLHRLAPVELRSNYRYQLGRIRALGDYYVKQKVLYERELEWRALAVLEDYPKLGADEVLRRSREQLNLYRNEPVLPELANELLDLAESLFWACGLQLTTSGQNGRSWHSGAYLNVVREPLNNHRWLAHEFLRALQLQEEDAKIAVIEAILAYARAGEKPFYYRLASRRGFALVANPADWNADPTGRSGAFCSTNYKLIDRALAKQGWYDDAPLPEAWTDSAGTKCGTPLDVHVPGLSPDETYTLRVAYPYAREQPDAALRTAAGTLLEPRALYDVSPVERPVFEYDLPQDAYADGTLRLRWQSLNYFATMAVSELWIVRKGGQ